MEYEDYLQTPAWKKRAAHEKRKVNFRCQDCWRVYQPWQLNVHHLRYKNLVRELDEDVIVLCEDCHFDRHFKTDYDTLLIALASI